MKPIISVIIPVYKVEKYMDKCIQSVVNQTYKDLEVILVDDGSPDSCPRKCDEWGKEDQRIRVLHKKNGGLSDARNRGIDIASGEYIAFVDSDDWIAPTMFEQMYQKISENDADMAICRYKKIFDDGHSEECAPFGKADRVLDTRDALTLLLEDSVITSHVWRKLYKRELITPNLFPVGKYYEDVFIMPELIMKSKKVVCMNEVFYYYRQNNDGILGSNSVRVNSDYCEALEYNVKMIENAFPELKKKAEYERYNKLEIIWWGLNFNSKEKKTAERKKLEQYLKKELSNIPKEFLNSRRKKIKFCVIRNMPWLFRIYFKVKTKLL